MELYCLRILTAFSLLGGNAAWAATVHFVDINSTNAVPPFTDWTTAAKNIQDAVDAASAGDTVLVTNGVYASGGRAAYGIMTNRVAVYKPLIVQSVAGPSVTIIEGWQIPGTANGDGAIRCVYLTNGASLLGFMLTNGATRSAGDTVYEQSGGGLWCESAEAMASNCVVTSSSAYTQGGGAYRGTLENCTLTGNSANGGFHTYGGGAYQATLNNCTLGGNSADQGGGTLNCTLNNCTLSGNSAGEGGGALNCTLNNCTLTGNLGGGAVAGTLNNCTLSGNSSVSGGGAEGAILNNCILSNNIAGAGSAGDGGGAFNCTLSNCILIANSLQGANGGGGGGAASSRLYDCTLINNTSFFAGGAFNSTLDNCLLTGNSAGGGGGVIGGTLNNCTLTGNSASFKAGGASLAVLNNCISYYNNCTNMANWDDGTTLYWCCTIPTPTNGFGNITNEPLFIDLAGGNLRLQSNSPCINSGRNAYAPAGPDLDRNPRIVGGTVDMGAYEFQFPTSIISYAWLQYYGFPTDGSADYADPDHDGMNNWQEWIAGTNPTNALSVLMMLAPSNTVSGVAVPWESVNGITYFLQRSTNVAVPPAFMSVQSNLLGQAGVTTFTDTNAVGAGAFFYRVGVQQ
jgi:hypothetical protein